MTEAPASIAARAFASANPKSLCKCTSISQGNVSTAFLTMVAHLLGSQIPTVSAKLIRDAPA